MTYSIFLKECLWHEIKIFVWNVNAHLMAAMFVLVGFRVNGEGGISKVSNLWLPWDYLPITSCIATSSLCILTTSLWNEVIDYFAGQQAKWTEVLSDFFSCHTACKAKKKDSNVACLKSKAHTQINQIKSFKSDQCLLFIAHLFLMVSTKIMRMKVIFNLHC